MLSLVSRHLKNMGFSVVEASEGDAAWRLAQEHVPDLVILDVMMPGMSGWEVCRRIKGEASDGRPFAGTGVIMLTGIGENLNDMTSPLFSADAWLNKPFEFGDLDERVRETLQRYEKDAPDAAGEVEQGSQPARRSTGRKAAGDAKKVGAGAKGAAKKAVAAVKGAAKKGGAAAKGVATKVGAGAKKAAKKAGAKEAGATRSPAGKAPAGKATPRKAASAQGGARGTAAKKAGGAKAPARAGGTRKAAAGSGAKKRTSR